ncbi:MAG: type II secretion system protein GspK [Sandaracinobacteroides sp.]
MRAIPKSERGAALMAVLAMVLLLAGFAALGLQRLKAAGDSISDARARSEAQLLASAATVAAVSVAARLKARARVQPLLLDQPLKLPFVGGDVTVRFSEGGNCFNLNSLARPPATSSSGEVPAAARPEEFARLLVAAGIPGLEANNVAAATAERLAATGLLWADASEWTGVPGVTQRHWDLAGPLLCALPTREGSALNINSLTPEKAPLLTLTGLGADQARRAIAARPAGGWASSSDFTDAAGTGQGNDERLQTSSRWMALTILAQTPRASIGRDLLVDTLVTPAEVVSSRWRAVEVVQ